MRSTSDGAYVTVTDANWTEQEAGIHCYLCTPRLSAHGGLLLIARLSASSLYLEKDQRFRGQSSLILTDHVTRLDAIPEKIYTAYLQDLRRGVGAISKTVHPDHMNIALLGNSCPHLHWTIVPRYRRDPRWGRPVWDDATLQQMRDRPVTLPAVEYSDLVENIRKHL
jgi:diadenosine tetraphosphate (Ap4A) HIT family hydrolase